MALVNGKSLSNALEIFIREHGRQPTTEEFSMLVSGKIERKQK